MFYEDIFDRIAWGRISKKEQALIDKYLHTSLDDLEKISLDWREKLFLKHARAYALDEEIPDWEPVIPAGSKEP